jgi:hypothetical protein
VLGWEYRSANHDDRLMSLATVELGLQLASADRSIAHFPVSDMNYSK